MMREIAKVLFDPAHRQRFLEGMSYAASTVNVVTTDGPAGRAGVTVSSMASVSADTPMPSLLVCVHHLSPAAAAINENGVFCVNVLREDQSHISECFAGRIKTVDGDKFSCAHWTRQITAAPRVVDPLAAFDCRLAQAIRIGTHYPFVGEVMGIFIEAGTAGARHGLRARFAVAEQRRGGDLDKAVADEDRS
jgi:flavin reductase (DIM6/NTAB) family NADH-FMN oxidoreductase RutF